MKKLIINADDLGINPQRSHGIFVAHEQGVLTSASLIVNTSDSSDAARRSTERDLPTGLHLNLTEGSPLSDMGDVESLLTTDGYFLGREALRRAFAEGTVEQRHLEREIRAQIEWFLQNRGQPTHVDGHHAIHVHPDVTPVLTPIMDRYGISFFVIPSEPAVPFGFEIDPKRSAFIELVSKEAEAARKMILANGMSGTDHFRGLALSGNASMRNLRHTLARLPDGTTRLMMHPGSPNPSGAPFDADPQRQTELNILLNPDTLTEIKEREIQLISFADLY